jgi:hypothetical protein
MQKEILEEASIAKYEENREQAMPDSTDKPSEQYSAS